ncbi:MAG TPA: S41 family peptidase [Thermoanaerobaculia bacterium]|nr:S41 family peptidase [Thermoanaerobaculia bacterium]
MRFHQLLAAAAVAAALAAPALHAQIDARMLRHPDVSETHVTFVYAGDIWVVAKEGGLAFRLSSPAGEESFPRFSPDGRRIAFSGNYHGNTDVYVIPTMGGMPERLTHHPMVDRVLDWYPDGDAILFSSGRHSGRQRFNQLYRVAIAGGLPEQLPLEYGEFASVSPDGNQLAMTIKTRAYRTWKRYRGGMAPDLWLYDFRTDEARVIASDPANDEMPMWHGRTIYFLSDRGPGGRFNVWAHDLDSGRTRQMTSFTDYDVHFPAIGPREIVFEAGGRLHLLDLASGESRAVEVRVVTDRATLQPAVRKVGELVRGASVSPSGKRAAVEARGEIFSLPAEHGPVLNLTNSSGVAERYPAWSPDGKWIAFFSDRSGEYELTIRPADGPGEETRLTSMGPGFRYPPVWSPDSGKLAFIDHAMVLRVYDRASRRLTEVEQQKWLSHGGLAGFDLAWSPDSRWLAWPRDQESLATTAIAIHDTRTGQTRQVTSGYYADGDPAFDPEGKYLFYLSSRALRPVYSDVDTSWIYPNSLSVMAIPLRSDVRSPIAPRNDVEGENDEEKEDADEKKDDAKDEKKKDEAPKPVSIDFDGFEARAVALPPPGGNYDNLQAAKGKLLFIRRPLAGSPQDAPGSLHFYDLEEREEKTILGEIDDYDLAAGGDKLLVVRKEKYAIVDLAADQKMDEPLATASLETLVDPAVEWRQIFDDAWRFERDYFYDPNMHGVDWDAIREQYGRLLEHAVTRSDVNFVIGEMIGELNASHTYRGGGDEPASERRSAGLLGADWVLDRGAFRIARIVAGGPWDAEVRSPLSDAGVKEGEWVLAVNGIPMASGREPWAAFDGLADAAVLLTVNDQPTLEGSRNVLVETLTPDEDVRLRHLAWIEQNRRRVEEATGGRAGYIYVPDTGRGGQTELVRQFRAQHHKDGLIIDERFNSGGQIPDRFVELLNRPRVAFWARRHGGDWPWPPVAHVGPKVMLINGWSGSGGDAFPAYFKAAGLGPLIGTRTWGGLIGISGNPGLVDGGGVTVPTFRMYSPAGEWFREGFGVEPDIEVQEDPAAAYRKSDPQLERAIAEVMQRIESAPARPGRPGWEQRIGQ